MTEEQILNTLDDYNDSYCPFVLLGHPYSYLIDSRLNVFRSDNDQWAIVIERLGYNPTAGAIILEIFYYGNCLINLDIENERLANNYSIYLIDPDNFKNTVEDEALKIGALHWIVRDQEIPLSFDKKDYWSVNIELNEYVAGEIRTEEAARLAIIKHANVFRATDDELYKSLPANLKKILALDEWYHKDFTMNNSPTLSEEKIRQTYDFNKAYNAVGGMDFDNFYRSIRQQEAVNKDKDKEMWDINRPGSYETWQQIAKVIVLNNPEMYKPSKLPNSHWSNWPDSGSL